jgi:hypothetical protein
MTAAGPGWHADPWGQAPLRYWDGSNWTGHVSGPPPPTPSDAENGNNLPSLSTWLQRYLIVEPIVTLGSVASSLAIAENFREFFRQFRDDAASADATLLQPTGLAALGQVLGVIAIIGTILRILWMIQAGKQAMARARTLRRSPVLGAFGWLIPIVNFWWPYQAMTDALGAGRANARGVKPWWALTVLAIAGAFATLVAGMFNTSTGWIVGIATVLARAGASAFEHRLVGEGRVSANDSVF